MTVTAVGLVGGVDRSWAATAQEPAQQEPQPAPPQRQPPQAESTRVTYWTLRPAVGGAGELPAGSGVTRADGRPPSEATAVPTTAAIPANMGRRREFVIAPLPMINPTLENGAALLVGALYQVDPNDRVSPPSGTVGMGFRTSNDSWAAGLAQFLHLHEDRYRIVAAGAYVDVNSSYFGVGASAGDAGRSVPLNQAGAGGIGELLVRVGGDWYLGARYRLMRTTVSADLEQTVVPIPRPDVKLRTASLGPHVERDTRDSQFYPRRGTLFDALAAFADEAVGGRRTYQFYQVQFSSYVSLGPRQVIASRVNACFADGQVPFYDLCLLGQYQDLRGYETGQYRDRSLLTGQAEYRLEFWKRVGLVTFAGAGEVAPAFDALSTDNVLPSGGAGLRFRLTKENHVNLRVDYAWGKKSHALYISVGEAF